MPIFISHTTRDDELAKKVFWRLNRIHDITCYIDDMDRELGNNRGKSSLTPLLVDRLRKCDTLLAVVTENTKGSWWVPFEIGTAREMPRVISSFTTLPDRSAYRWQETLPEYLLEWPRLRADSDIEVFAREYKRQSLLLEKSIGLENFSQRSASVNNARSFESTVMKSLGQRSY
jgi:hypothetical protein